MTEKISQAQGARLADARAKAGWRSARAAALNFDWAESTYRAHESGTRTIGLDDAERYGKAFGTTGKFILFGDGAPPEPAPDREPTARIAPEAEVLYLGEKDVPIMGTMVGGERGDFYLNGEIVDYARRLPGIARRANVFGVHVEGSSMEPKFEPGELVYAAPGRTPAAGDYVIIELAPAEGERNGPAFVKRWLRRSGNRIICEQHNPAEELEYDAREVKAIYRIIPLAELAGF